MPDRQSGILGSGLFLQSPLFGNPFRCIFVENFEGEWPLGDPFESIFTEDFEGSWPLGDPFENIFTENFENGDW